MAAITSAVIGVGAGAYQAIQGAKQKKQAQNELNNYERQALTNAYENIQISTVGSDMIKEQNARTTSNILDLAQNAGARGVFGALPKIQEVNNNANQEARAYLDSQVQKRNYAIADDEVALRKIKENRDVENLSAISSQINAGEQAMQDGIYSGLSAISSLGRAVDSKRANKIKTNDLKTKSTTSSAIPQYKEDDYSFKHDYE